MPLYDYKCTKCGHIFEVQQRISEEPLEFCPNCKGEIKRLISAAGIIFKGSGFHVTDYAKSSKPQVSNPKVETKETKTGEKSAEGGSASSGKEPAKETKKEAKPSENKKVS